jgi:V/A-type H+-transporting ATPase subunit D
VARRGAELLDEKFRAREAERWQTRAALISGERQLALSAAAVAAPAEASVRWRAILGVTCPAEAAIAPRPAAEPVALGGGAALLSAVTAHRRALEAALDVAVAEGAVRRIDAELRATRLRRNAIVRTWSPAHADTLRTLELALEELEREDGARLRRVTRARPSRECAFEERRQLDDFEPDSADRDRGRRVHGQILRTADDEVVDATKGLRLADSLLARAFPGL